MAARTWHGPWPALAGLAALAVAGCAGGPARPEPRPANMTPHEYQAAQLCLARGRMAGAAYPDRSILGWDGIAASRATSFACWNAYKATGIMPTY